MASEAPDYSPFEGDGRLVVLPMPMYMTFQNWKSSPIRAGMAKRIIDNFVVSGRSCHSAACSTLWVILTWCEHHKQPYRLTMWPGMGAEVERVKDLP